MKELERKPLIDTLIDSAEITVEIVSPEKMRKMEDAFCKIYARQQGKTLWNIVRVFN